MIHLATIPVDNTSVNPARSFGTAIFSSWDAIAQLWVFIVFPLVGGVLGVLVWLLVHEERLEDTMFGGQRSLANVRGRAATASHGRPLLAGDTTTGEWLLEPGGVMTNWSAEALRAEVATRTWFHTIELATACGLLIQGHAQRGRSHAPSGPHRAQRPGRRRA